MNKVNIMPTIKHLSKNFQGILLDAYGVFWGGNACGVLPGSKEVMEHLVAEGKTVGILSNSTQLASKERDKFKANGLIEGTHFHFILTSGEVARHTFANEILPFATPNNAYCLFGPPHPKFSSHHHIFELSPFKETTNLKDADFVYISIPHINGEDKTSPDLFRDSVASILDTGLPMVCSNPDRFAHEGNPPQAVVRQGTIASLYEEMGGKVFYIGKPYPRVYDHAMKEFMKHDITDHTTILMVGDTPETDIRGANTFGMPSVLLTETGIMAERISHHGMESLNKLQGKDIPTYYIQRLG